MGLGKYGMAKLTESSEDPSSPKRPMGPKPRRQTDIGREAGEPSDEQTNMSRARDGA